MKKEKWVYGKGEFPTVFGAIVLLLLIVVELNFGPLLSFALYSIPISQVYPYSILFDFLVVMAPFLLTFLILLAASNALLKTRVRKLITGDRDKLNIKFALLVFLIYFVMMGIFSLFSIKSIHFDSSPLMEKLMLLLPVLLLLPIQSITEEVIYRVLPLRLIYRNYMPRTFKSSIAMILVSGVLFLIPHIANNEVSMNASSILALLYYFLWGSFAMALALYTDGFEAPIAMHMANNLFIALIVNYENGVIPSRPIFINTSTLSQPILSLVEVVVMFLIIFIFSHFAIKKRPDAFYIEEEDEPIEEEDTPPEDATEEKSEESTEVVKKKNQSQRNKKKRKNG